MKFKKLMPWLIAAGSLLVISAIVTPIAVAFSSKNSRPKYNVAALGAYLSNNFNKMINSSNYVESFNTEENAKQTISKLCENVITPNEINRVRNINKSTSNDDTLVIDFDISLNNGQSLIVDNLETEVVNVDAEVNKNNFQFKDKDQNIIIGISDKGKKQKELYFPSNVTTLELKDHYSNDNDLSELEKIDFSYCTNLSKIDGFGAFSNCPNLKYVSFFGNEELKALPNSFLANNKKLKTIIFDNCYQLTKISQNFASGCSNLSNISLKDCVNLNLIEKEAFKATAIETIDLSSTYRDWEAIQLGVFADCENLREVNLSNINDILITSSSFPNYEDRKIKILGNSENIKEIITNNFPNCEYVATEPNNNINVGYYGINKIINDDTFYNDIQDAFLNNARDVANRKDVNLFYCINSSNKANQYGMIAHLINILEINPNINAHLLISREVSKQFNLDILTTNYGNNIKLHIVDNLDINNINNFNFQYAKDILEIVQDNKLTNNVLYIDDYSFLNFVKDEVNNETNISFTQQSNIINSYYQIAKNFNEINIIPNGIESTDFYSNKLFNLFNNLNNKIFEFNESTNTFDGLINLQEEYVSNKNEQEAMSFISQSDENFWIFVASLITSNNLNQTKNVVQVNYYVPTTNMIKDINNYSSEQFNANILENEYFDPYNSKGYGLKNLIGNLTTNHNKGMESFLKVFNVPVDELIATKNQFSNYNNVVFEVADQSEDQVVNNLKQILMNLIDGELQIKEKLQIWLKFETGTVDDSYYERIITRISTAIPDLNKEQFKKLSNSITFDVYNAYGIFDNDETTTVKQYVQYSSYALMALNDNNNTFVIINDFELNDIWYRFGNPNNSLCFPIQHLRDPE